MEHRVVCPHCGATIRLPEAPTGKVVLDCPACDIFSVVEIPDDAATEPASAQS